MNFNNKTILISGGTGSFGKCLTDILLKKYNLKKIIIYSRDELKQFEMKNNIKNKNYLKKLRFFIGDVRDQERLDNAFRGNKIDIVIHAAALKQVPTAEYNPFEVIKTNIIGAQNIINSCVKFRVKKVIALSTDKAASPINLYGATKLASDKLFVSSNNYANPTTKLSVVRYGNVLGSRGSVLPIFIKMSKSGKFDITDKRMTRFSLSLEEGVNFVIKCLTWMWGGEIFVPKIPSYNILDVARAINAKAKINIIGIRPGEKLHEEMISISDSFNTVESTNFYAILPSNSFLDWNMKDYISKNKYLRYKRCKENFTYNSFKNNDYLSIEKLKKMIDKFQKQWS